MPKGILNEISHLEPHLRECVNRFDEPEVLRLILSKRLRIMIDVVVLINTVT